MMAGLSISDLPLPARRFDPTRTPNFESDDFSENEDRNNRAPALYEQSYLNDSLFLRPAGLDLARRLDGASAPATLASSRSMRDVRRRVIGEAWRLHDSLGSDCGTTFHLVPENSSCLPSALMGVNAQLQQRAFRSDLNRALKSIGSPSPRGGLLAFLHGEYNMLTSRFSVHWHGYAFGGMLAAVEALRDRPKYAAGRAGDGRDAIARPVVVKREPLTGLPYPLTYLLKAYWPRVYSEKGDDGAADYRSGHVRRIPEPYHSLSLLWLNQWRLQDISLLMGLRVTREGLHP